MTGNHKKEYIEFLKQDIASVVELTREYGFDSKLDPETFLLESDRRQSYRLDGSNEGCFFNIYNRREGRLPEIQYMIGLHKERDMEIEHTVDISHRIGGMEAFTILLPRANFFRELIVQFVHPFSDAGARLSLVSGLDPNGAGIQPLKPLLSSSIPYCKRISSQGIRRHGNISFTEKAIIMSDPFANSHSRFIEMSLPDKIKLKKIQDFYGV